MSRRRTYREDYTEEEWEFLVSRFADPGGESALHPETENNPRDRACPTCHTENVLTRRDRQAGYQCDNCADQAERGY